MTEEDPDKVVFINRRDDGITVKVEGVVVVEGMEEMLNLLEQDYEVTEELSGETFLMAKKGGPPRAR